MGDLVTTVAGPEGEGAGEGGGCGNPGAVVVVTAADVLANGPGVHAVKPAASAEPKAPYVPAVPVRIPVVGDRVLFVLRPMGSGIGDGKRTPYWPKVRPADVVEDWAGIEKHPTGKVHGPDGKVVLGEDGKPVVPPGTVNLKICLDGHARKDHNDGHYEYEGHVLYDPKKGHRTWHWAGD